MLYKHVQGVVALMVKVIVNSYSCVEYIQLTSSHTQVLPLISELLFIFGMHLFDLVHHTPDEISKTDLFLEIVKGYQRLTISMSLI